MHDIAQIQLQFGDHLFNFINGRLSSKDDAQDIYQEVILKIMEKSGQLEKKESLKSWLFTIARNQIIDYYRKKKKAIFIDEIDENKSEHPSENDYTELESCLIKIINKLPEDYRQVIIASEIEGTSQKELAQALNMNYVTLRSKIQRGREKIKKLMFDACKLELSRAGGVMNCFPKKTTSVCSPDTGSSCN